MWRFVSRLWVIFLWSVGLALVQNHSLDYWSFVAGFETKNPPRLFFFFKLFWLFWVPQTTTPILKLVNFCKETIWDFDKEWCWICRSVWICIDFEWFSCDKFTSTWGYWVLGPLCLPPAFLCKHLPHRQAPVLDPDKATHCALLCIFLFVLSKKLPSVCLFMAVLGLCCGSWAFSGWGKWAFSSCGGFSCCRAQVLGHVGFSSCGTWVL